MYPSPFEYVAATTVDEAIALLQQHGEDAKVLAGGHSLIPLMKLRFAAPSVLVDIGPIADLAGARISDGHVEIGATTTYSALLISDAARAIPLLAETTSHIGDTQVRNRGTIGGSIAHADPAGDMPAALLALDATVVVQGPQGERQVPATDFIQGPFTSDLQPDEVVTRLRINRPSGRSGYAYEKIRNPASGYAIVGIAAAVTVDDRGRLSDARVAITGAGSQPMRASGVEASLRGASADDETILSAAERIGDGLEFTGDLHASETHRTHLARVCTRRALLRALQGARAS